MKYAKILFFFFFTLKVQTSDFSGSFFDLAAYQHYNNSIYNEDLPDNYKDNFINLSRLNLSGSIDVTKFSSFNLSLQSELFYKMKNYNILNYNFSQSYQLDNLRYNYTDNQFHSGTFSIKELNYFHDFNYIKIRFGRQVMNWGFNRIWKATDLFYTIFEPNYLNHDKPGVDALSTDLIIDSTSSINIVVNFNHSISRFNYVGRYNFRNHKITFSALTGYFEKKPLAGIELSKKIWDIDFRFEGLYSLNTQGKDSNQISILLGADYQINDKLKLSADYFVNGKSQNCKCSYNLFQIRDENISSLAKYYFAEALEWSFTDKSKINATLVQNLNDNSGYVQLRSENHLFEKITFNLAGIINYGNEFDEFWYYPSSIYFSINYKF